MATQAPLPKQQYDIILELATKVFERCRDCCSMASSAKSIDG